MTVLGGLSPATFLRRHWQKRPLLVRQAMPGFAGLVDRDALLALATRDDVSSRLVIERPRRRARWERHDGPFGGLDAGMLPARRWTLLVHGLEGVVPGGWELLRRFAFIPAARIDDLMVSYAADGGGVGPHDDRYDVFLLQGPGRRRWRISTQRDRRVDPEAAIRVLADFRAEEEWLLEPGDMLYLPPGVAHEGIAEGECFTYSVGFLAPSHRELIAGFHDYLAHARIDEDALYADPDLRPARAPLEVSDQMVARVAALLRGVRWGRAEVGEFLGRFLTMPRPRARFAPPRRPLSAAAFARCLRGRGRLALALASRGLVRGELVFLNGRAFGKHPVLERLLSERSLEPPLRGGGAALETLYGWYRDGWLLHQPA
jgi:50S ribosomal protein L16 3-hydroxylase